MSPLWRPHRAQRRRGAGVPGDHADFPPPRDDFILVEPFDGPTGDIFGKQLPDGLSVLRREKGVKPVSSHDLSFVPPGQIEEKVIAEINVSLQVEAHGYELNVFQNFAVPAFGSPQAFFGVLGVGQIFCNSRNGNRFAVSPAHGG